jgi:hypothetical protein
MMVLMIFSGIFCLISGFILSLPFLIDQNVPLEDVKDVTDPFRIYIAIIDLILALLNIFGTGWPIIGNILPGVMILLCALGLSDKLLNYINFSSNPEKSRVRKDKLRKGLKNFSVLIGILTFIVGILHFFLWRIIIF